LYALITANPIQNKAAKVQVILEKGGGYLIGTKENTSKRLKGAAKRPEGLPLFDLSQQSDQGRIDARKAAVESISPVNAELPGARPP
jgi:hypothetical protein